MRGYPSSGSMPKRIAPPSPSREEGKTGLRSFLFVTRIPGLDPGINPRICRMKEDGRVKHGHDVVSEKNDDRGRARSG